MSATHRTSQMASQDVKHLKHHTEYYLRDGNIHILVSYICGLSRALITRFTGRRNALLCARPLFSSRIHDISRLFQNARRFWATVKGHDGLQRGSPRRCYSPRVCDFSLGILRSVSLPIGTCPFSNRVAENSHVKQRQIIGK